MGNIAQRDRWADFTKEFWRSGAVLRGPAGRWWLLAGLVPESQPDKAHLGGLNFFADQEIWWRAQDQLELSTAEVCDFLVPFLSERHLHKNDFLPASKDNFETSFRVIQGKIQRQEIEKAIPITQTYAPSSPTTADLAQSLLKLAELPERLHVYGYWLGRSLPTKDTSPVGKEEFDLVGGEGVIGATPELLFTLQEGNLSTMALAGSCPKSEIGSRLPLLKDPKELKEHQIVVDDLVQHLKSVGWLRQGSIELVELPTLQHLMTRIEVSGVSKSPEELMRRLHPTPAMGVAPRGYGFQWLKELPEQKDRGLFGAPIVFRRPQQILALVAIRSLFWNQAGSRVFAGCGVVAASQLDREFAEVLAKIDSVFQMLGT